LGSAQRTHAREREFGYVLERLRSDRTVDEYNYTVVFHGVCVRWNDS
jgi:hypothetical protein